MEMQDWQVLELQKRGVELEPESRDEYPDEVCSLYSLFAGSGAFNPNESMETINKIMEEVEYDDRLFI